MSDSYKPVVKFATTLNKFKSMIKPKQSVKDRFSHLFKRGGFFDVATANQILKELLEAMQEQGQQAIELDITISIDPEDDDYLFENVPVSQSLAEPTLSEVLTEYLYSEGTPSDEDEEVLAAINGDTTAHSVETDTNDTDGWKDEFADAGASETAEEHGFPTQQKTEFQDDGSSVSQSDNIDEPPRSIDDDSEDVLPETFDDDPIDEPPRAFEDDLIDENSREYVDEGDELSDPVVGSQEVGTQIPPSTADNELPRIPDYMQYLTFKQPELSRELDRDALLAKVGLSDNLSKGNGLEKERHQLFEQLYGENEFDVSHIISDVTKEVQSEATEVLESLKDHFEEVNQDSIDDAVKHVTEDATAEFEAQQNDEWDMFNQDLAFEYDKRKKAIEEQKESKIEAYKAQMEAEASAQRDSIAQDMDRRRYEKQAAQDAAKTDFDAQLKQKAVLKEVENRNRTLQIKKEAQMKELQEVISEKNDEIAQTADHFSKAYFQKDSDLVKKEQSRQEKMAAQQLEADRIAADNKAAQAANNAAQAAEKLLEANKNQAQQGVPTNQAPTVMYLPPNNNDNHELLMTIKNMIDKQSPKDSVASSNADVSRSDNQITKKRHVAAWLGFVAAFGLGGAGVYGADQIHQAYQSNQAMAVQISHLNQEVQTAKKTPEKKSLNELIASGDYEKAAKSYGDQTSIDKIERTIFQEGNESELKQFNQKHQSTFGRLDLAILNGDHGAIETQYKALTKEEQARLNMIQRNAINANATTQNSSNTGKSK